MCGQYSGDSIVGYSEAHTGVTTASRTAISNGPCHLRNNPLMASSYFQFQLSCAFSGPSPAMSQIGLAHVIVVKTQATSNAPSAFSPAAAFLPPSVPTLSSLLLSKNNFSINVLDPILCTS